MTSDVVRSACAVIRREDDGAVLLIRRRRPPEAGRWSVPGGKSLPGEDTRRTAQREALEETGLEVEIGDLLWTVDLTLDDGLTYRIDDYEAWVRGGILCAADDALDARWVPPEDLAGLPLAAELLPYLRRAGIAPGP